MNKKDGKKIQKTKNSDIIEKIKEFKNNNQYFFNTNSFIDDKNISNSDILLSAKEINDLRFDVERSKIGNALGIDGNQITIATERYIGAGETMRVGDKVYTTQGKDSTISGDIAKYIKETGDLQTYCMNIQNSSFNREDAIKHLKKDLQKVNKFAASEIKVDDRENISVDWTTNKEFKDLSQNQEQK